MDSQFKDVKTIVLGNKPLREYLVEIIVSLNREASAVEIIGRGRNIYRAVNLYNALVSRIGDRVSIRDIEIGSMLVGGRRVSFIRIVVQRVS